MRHALDGARSAATETVHQPRSSTPSSSKNMDEGRFPPGTLLAQRYRIVSLLGRGGMGEVYRANDLLLGQTVALKFLPAQWTSDEPTLARFRNEVRIARQISHPNVCRVYDIGEAEGSTYLSMEYVDGEDLASLLRRIGRLPQDKALEIARQLCAGLAAAHDKGVVHRDLKPGNIMLDGQGQLRITDFGLAGVAGEVKDIRSGTPGYMAPEQRSGQEVTARSDIYALGVVLHEVFTGKRPSADSSHPDLAPEVDRVIRRCLAEDPAKRPASALQVAAALPGGDPLAAALAAGETPSPEMVAAAGEHEGLRPLVCLGLAGRRHCVSRRGDSVECTIDALPARAARKTAGSACRARAEYSAECRLFRAAGGYGDGVLRGERVSTLYRGTRQIQDALGQPRDRGVCVLVSRQPPPARGSFLLVLLGCTHRWDSYGRTTRRWMCPG